MSKSPEVTFSADARAVLSRAADECGRLRHRYIQSEHILLGLLRHEEGWTAQLLDGEGIDLTEARRVVETQTGRGSFHDHLVGMGVSGKRAVELAVESCVRSSDPTVTAGHLLLGCLEAEKGLAGSILILSDINVVEFKKRVAERLNLS